MSEQGEGEVEQPQLDFGLPESVLEVLPSDPFEQLDVARKITSIALATRVARLESEAAWLRATLAEKDDLVAELRVQLETLDASLSDMSSQLARVEEEKENLVNENVSLSNTVKKLNRDVSKFEDFKKTFMKSLQEEDETPHVGPPRARVTESLDEDLGLSALKISSAKSQSSEGASSVTVGSNYVEAEVLKVSRSLGPLASQGATPRMTPPDSPTRVSASGSPTRTFRSSSPRRHSIAVTRNMYDDRSSLYSSLPSHHSSMTSPFDTANQTGRTRVDGKEFFRQVRSRLSYEQFSAFLANVKELNAHKQTREETLRKADEIFGQDNKDLYTIFEGLISRNLH
ncbi:hypothetical protein FCM35_KLT19542 [Carex littledalei]|uniref:At4g15545-like C-terminal domain-containing protein n=1 Tax=Carex littledalei TaxID=544730 RepID=A0A833VFM9_9POAL|nr:hypothetical protein FCM35_KLT19542 [Carex littledalei]